jgi:hypothetical protein
LRFPFQVFATLVCQTGAEDRAAAPAELDGTEAPKARIAAGDENGTNILGLFPAGYLYRGVQAKEGKEVTMKEVV